MSEIKNIVAALIKEQTNVDLTQTTNLISGGFLDSFAVLMLVSSLESQFGIEFGFDEDIYQALESLDGVVTLVEKHLKQSTQEHYA